MQKLTEVFDAGRNLLATTGGLLIFGRGDSRYVLQLNNPQWLAKEMWRMKYDTPIFASAVQKTANYVVGGGLEVVNEDQSTQDFLTSFNNDVDYDIFAYMVAKNMIYSGNCYAIPDIEFYEPGMVTDEETKLTILDPKNIYIDYDEDLNVNGYIREVKLQFKDSPRVGRHEIKFPHKKSIIGIRYDPEDIVHFAYNQDDDEHPYGMSPYIPALIYSRYLRQAETSLNKIARDKAVPRKLFFVSGKFDPQRITSKLRDGEATGESQIFQGRFTKDDINPVDLSYAGKDINIDYILKHYMSQIISGNVPKFIVGIDSENASGLYGDTQWRTFTLDIKLIQRIIEKKSEREIYKRFFDSRKISEFPDIKFNEVNIETAAQRHDSLRKDFQTKAITRGEYRQRVGEDLEPFGDERDDEFAPTAGPGLGSSGVNPQQPMKPGEQEALKELSEAWKLEDGKYNLYRSGKVIHTQDVSLKVDVSGTLTNTVDELLKNYPFPSIVRGIKERETSNGILYITSSDPVALDKFENYIYVNPQIESMQYNEVQDLWRFQVNRAWADMIGEVFSDDFLRTHKPVTNGDQVNGWIKTSSASESLKKKFFSEADGEKRPLENKELDDLEDSFSKILQENLVEQEVKVNHRLENMKRYVVKEQLQNSISKVIAALPEPNIYGEVYDTINRAVQNGLDEAGKQLGRNFSVDEKAVNFLANHTFENIKDMNSEISNDLRRELETGIMEGEGITNISKRIQKVFEVNRPRADTIARTEINRASNEGRISAYEESGLPGKVQWLAHIDSRTSKVCQDLNGDTIPLGGKFESRHLKNPVSNPPAHPNCRSTVVFLPSTKGGG